MRNFLFSWYAGLLVAFGAFVAVACLVCSFYINRLQADLARAVQQEAAALEAAIYLQVNLRHLRVHALVLVADRTDARRKIVQGDLRNVDLALQAVRQTAVILEDAALGEKIEQDYARYQAKLELDRLPTPIGPMSELARWSDAHHMEEILDSCRELADRQRKRMKNSVEQSEIQTAWAGKGLLSLGVVGIGAGLLSGYVAARALTRRVAQLFVRVQAVHATLDQDIGAMTIQGPPHFGDLDAQIERVVERVDTVCKRLQEQERELIRAEQLAVVGQLATGIAHEVRNPLTGVKLLLQGAVRPHDPIPLTADRVHLLLQEIARIERTVQGLMNFARKPLDRQPHDLRAIVETAVHLVHGGTERKSIAVRVDAPPTPVQAMVDRDQVLSLLTNLLYNAIEAAPANSEVTVSIMAGSHESIQITVLDRGPGIDAAIAGKLFTPFATTKPGGTGLGLTVARRIAQEHGGTLIAADRPNGGAIFTLTLPVRSPLSPGTPGERGRG